ncbi:MAG: lipid-transfer protein [bacterium]|nr:lipid-transfer protein [bacterium]
MGRKTFVVGVGMTKFEKPGGRDWDYPDMAREAGTNALEDAGIRFDEIEQAAVGYCYGDSTTGERAFYELGHSGIPIYNVNNNCSTGSTALHMAKQFVEGGLADCVMALGFEKMEKGSLGIKYTDRTMALDKHFAAMNGACGFDAKAPPAAQMFGNAGREHMERYGTTAEHFAKIGYKNHKHSVNNPYSQFQDEYTLEEIKNAPVVFDPLTKLQCCPTSDGSAAAIVASEDFVNSHGLRDQAIEILGMTMTTDFASSFEGSMIKMVGSDMTRDAAQKVYEQSGLGPENVDVIELHDCFSANEVVTYEALGLCPEGKAGEFIDSGANTYGGKVVVNPSGGLISKGHPLGATGLAQCAELNWQLRGEAEKRQVDGAKVALQHNLGLGGAAVVTLYRKTDIA